MEAERFQILSLDGGGIRGLFSAALLAAVEDDLGTTVADHFDLIAGTSTGGIIAIALGLGISPREIVEFYVEDGPQIFCDRLKLRRVQHWFRRKYSARPLETALRRTFRDRLFGESSKRLVIPTYNIGDDDVYIFRTPHAERLRRDFRVPAWKVALATTAAPTYFPACRAVDNLRLVDGGLWANNPSMVALVESFGTLNVPLDRTRLLSIGTYEAVNMQRSYLDRGGRLVWAPHAADVLLRAGSIGVNNQVRFLLGKEQHLRVDPKVAANEIVLDRPNTAADLIGRARHHSRQLMPVIFERFADNTAQRYSPIYTTSPENESDSKI